MKDIFISYANEDRDWVERFSDQLEQAGWSIWWDRSIPIGKSFHEVIEKALGDARCVIVVWSKHSVNSSWVKAEAEEARDRAVLIPVLINDVKPPLVFRQLQTADLTDWDGDQDHDIYQRLTLVSVQFSMIKAQMITVGPVKKRQPKRLLENRRNHKNQL